MAVPPPKLTVTLAAPVVLAVRLIVIAELVVPSSLTL